MASFSGSSDNHDQDRMNQDDLGNLLSLSLSTEINSPNPTTTRSSIPRPSPSSSTSTTSSARNHNLPPVPSMPAVRPPLRTNPPPIYARRYQPLFPQQYPCYGFFLQPLQNPSPIRNPNLLPQPIRNPNVLPTPIRNPYLLPTPIRNPNPNPVPQETPTTYGTYHNSRRRRRTANRTVSRRKSETVPPPFPWATDRRATVHNLDYLIANKLTAISGEVQCRRCEAKFEITYDLREKFREVAMYIVRNKYDMHNRAPAVWMNPNFPNCDFCHQNNCVRPVTAKKRSINWLFLLLGQMLGSCKIADLKYFCKHTKNHRTGAKDRVLYYTYLDLCKQLDPDGPFDI